MTGLETILAAHERLNEGWRWVCSCSSSDFGGFTGFNAHVADQIRGWLLSDEVIEQAQWAVDTPHGIHGRVTARNVITAALDTTGDS